VFCRPVTGKRLQRDQLDALRPVFDELVGGPARHGDTLAKILQRLIRDGDLKRADVGVFRGGVAHAAPPL
jgi:hypothetical protein